MSTKPTPLVNDISDAAGILRAHGHTELAERLLALAEVAHKTERERAARICELMRPIGGRAWTAEQAACFEALTEAAKAIRDTANASAVSQGMPGMSELNRSIAYSAANKLRELGFRWDEAKADWIATTDAPATGQVSIKNIDGVIPVAISGYLRRCSSGGMPKKHIDIVQANVDEADRLGYFKLAIAQAMLAAAPEAPATVVAQVPEDLHDFTTHRASWRKAIQQLADADDSGYWPHELRAFDAAMLALDAYIAAPEAPAQAAPSAGEAERETIKARLDKAERDLREVGGWDNELHGVPAGGVRKLIEDVRATLASQQAVKAEATTTEQGALRLAVGAGTMQVGGRYKWKHQDERLVYLGVTWSGNRFWHQFALVDDPTKVWCEVPSSDLHMFELDTRP